MIRTLRKFWKKATSNPGFALGAIGLGSAAFGALGSSFFPETYKSTIGFLDMEDTIGPYGPPAGPYRGSATTLTGRRGYGATIGAGKFANLATAKKATFLGMDKGLLYDIRKGIGKTLSTPFKMGALFGTKGAGYNYLMGQGTWGQLKRAFQGTLPFKTGEGGALYDAYQKMKKAGRAPIQQGRGGGGGSGYTRRRSGVSGTYQMPTITAGQTKGYNPNGVSANLLRNVYKDEPLWWIDREARQQRAIGPNIDFKTSIGTGGRYQRVR